LVNQFGIVTRYMIGKIYDHVRQLEVFCSKAERIRRNYLAFTLNYRIIRPNTR
jgi:hypothetical protein